MSSPIDELCDLMDEAGLTMKFGLVQQGHIQTVERMLDEGKRWDEIGKAINWCPDTARDWYTSYARSELAAERQTRAAAEAEVAVLRELADGAAGALEGLGAPHHWARKIRAHQATTPIDHDAEARVDEWLKNAAPDTECVCDGDDETGLHDYLCPLYPDEYQATTPEPEEG